jgi:hypothetical protein
VLQKVSLHTSNKYISTAGLVQVEYTLRTALQQGTFVLSAIYPGFFVETPVRNNQTNKWSNFSIRSVDAVDVWWSLQARA